MDTAKTSGVSLREPLAHRQTVDQEAERLRVQQEARTNRIRLLQTAVELAKLGWEVAERLWR